jgi:hypothetical protein
MRPLTQCLLDTNLVRLQTIARFWDVDLTTNRQRDAAGQLAEAMASPKTIADAWDALRDEEQQALSALVAAGGQVPLRVFARQWGEIRAMGPGRLEREQPWREPVSPVEGLWYRGFIFRAFEQGAEGTYEVVFAPPELQAHIPIHPTPPPAITLEPGPEPATVHQFGDTLLDDACTFLAYLQNERLRPDPDGRWPSRHEARLARRLHNPDPGRLAFLHHLVRRLGWLRLIDSGRLRPDPGPVTEWLQSSTVQQRGVLVEGWRDDSTWNDLFHIPTLHAEDTGAWHNDPLLARRAILRHLKACLLLTWYRLDDIITAVKEIEPDFQRPDGDYTSWYIRDAATGAYQTGFESWHAVEGALIHYLIAGPLAWLGLTSLGASTPDGPPAAFRLTRAGAASLGLAEPSPKPEPEPVTLQPDFTILVPLARRYERFQLARVTDWIHTGDHFVYRLTPTALERGRQQGIAVARVLEFLGQVTDAPVPHFIEAALTRWETRGTEARLERVVLLRLSDEGLMTQVVSSPLTRDLIQERTGPTTALVRGRDWHRLVAALGKMGLLPDVDNLNREP